MSVYMGYALKGLTFGSSVAGGIQAVVSTGKILHHVQKGLDPQRSKVDRIAHLSIAGIHAYCMFPVYSAIARNVTSILLNNSGTQNYIQYFFSAAADQERVLILRAADSADHNGAMHMDFTRSFKEGVIGDHRQVAMRTIHQPLDVCKAIADARQHLSEAEKVNVLIFSGHGTPYGIDLSTQNIHTYSYFADGCFDGVREDAVVVLNSCNTGLFGKESFASIISERINRTVMAPERLINEIIIPKTGRIEQQVVSYMGSQTTTGRPSMSYMSVFNPTRSSSQVHFKNNRLNQTYHDFKEIKVETQGDLESVPRLLFMLSELLMCTLIRNCVSFEFLDRFDYGIFPTMAIATIQLLFIVASVVSIYEVGLPFLKYAMKKWRPPSQVSATARQKMNQVDQFFKVLQHNLTNSPIFNWIDQSYGFARRITHMNLVGSLKGAFQKVSVG